MGAARFTEADLSRALKAWTKAGLPPPVEASILPDGTIRLRSKEGSEQSAPINPADLVDP